MPWRVARWADVFGWAHGEAQAARKTGDQPRLFLLEQLVEYLKLTGLAPFAGFLSDDFGYMASPAAARTWERQAEVKGRLSAFFEALVSGLGEPERAPLGDVKIGTLPLSARSAWAQTHAGTNGMNLTVELWEDELQLDLVAWRQPQALIFRRWLKTDAPASPVELTGHEIVIFKRRAHKGPSGNPYWQRETFEEVGRAPAEDLPEVAATIEQCEHEMDPKWEKLAFHLRLAWPSTEVVASGEAIVDDVRARLLALAPLVSEINDGA